MQRTVRTLLVAGAIVFVGAPMLARAEGFVVPWIGTSFSQGPDFPAASSQRPSFGAALGTIGGGGIFGVDIDVGYTPSFFGPSSGSLGNNSLITAMADLILGLPIESRGGKGARPYASIGSGLIRSQTNTSGPANANNFGWNGGGGVMGNFSSHVGLRGDLRYFRTVNNTTVANTISLSPGSFHFWRASVGLILR